MIVSSSGDHSAGKATLTTSSLFPYWLIASSVGVWFLFVYAPPRLRSKNLLQETPLFAIHLIGSYVVYLACIHNSYITGLASTTSSSSSSSSTTSVTSYGKQYHILFGKISMIVGTIFGFLAGVLLVVFYSEILDLGFSIGITVGGLYQINMQFHGYKAIRRYQEIKKELAKLKWIKGKESIVRAAKNAAAAASSSNKSHTTSPTSVATAAAAMTYPSSHDVTQTTKDKVEEANIRIEELKQEQMIRLQEHVYAMIHLFVMGCGVPASMRIVEVLVGTKVGIPWLNVLLLIPMKYFASSYVKQITSTFTTIPTPPNSPQNSQRNLVDTISAQINKQKRT